ncbi:MAG: ATP-binding protein [Candidatus Aenigmarchaeota archaeon]|nr:ATP-binding protein [Candidatus Aenigmarchaeota archaeon]
MQTVGQILGGEFSKIIVRQKSGRNIELGELLAADTKNGTIIFQVYDLEYGSQISREAREMMSGLELEGFSEKTEVIEGEMRNYVIAHLEAMLHIVEKNKAKTPKCLADFFSCVREVSEKDFSFLSKPEDTMTLGMIRSGSKALPIEILLSGKNVLRHHILIPATTGRGKSNLVKYVAWNLIEKDWCALLVLDPHDEYYGRIDAGLKDHPRAKEKVVYYTADAPPAGARTLKINTKCIRPWHFGGALNLSEPQEQLLYAFYNAYKEDWIENILSRNEEHAELFDKRTLDVVLRQMQRVLGAKVKDGNVSYAGIFDNVSGTTTVSDIVSLLESSKTVIVDTSTLSGSAEILVGSIISSEVFEQYKRLRQQGKLGGKPVVSIVLEEAPRVIGQDVLQRGPNIFSTIAREGRKFNIGLLAITQLPSLIPKQILANMNTKIILGLELASERRAIIESASQDLSKSEKTIASLDMGEAIITSNFTKFAVPIKLPHFEKIVSHEKKKDVPKQSFRGLVS